MREMDQDRAGRLTRRLLLICAIVTAVIVVTIAVVLAVILSQPEVEEESEGKFFLDKSLTGGSEIHCTVK